MQPQLIGGLTDPGTASDFEIPEYVETVYSLLLFPILRSLLFGKYWGG